MIKVLLLDVDGVIIKNHEYFSSRYKRDFGKTLNNDVVGNFFKTEFKLCSVGRDDLKELLKDRLKDWGWNGTLDELLNYWFSGEIELDNEVIDISRKVKFDGIPVYLVSDNEKYRAEYLEKKLGLNSMFNGVYYSCNLGFTKSDTKFFTTVLQILNVYPNEILYFDDDPKNIDVASGVGINSVVYEGFDKFVEKLKEFGVKV